MRYLRHKKALVHVNLHKWDFNVFRQVHAWAGRERKTLIPPRKCQDTERHKKWKMIRNKKQKNNIFASSIPWHERQSGMSCRRERLRKYKICEFVCFTFWALAGTWSKWDCENDAHTRRNKQLKKRKRGNLRERKQQTMGNSRHDKKWNGIISDGKTRPSLGNLTRWTSKGSLSFVQTLFEDSLMNFSAQLWSVSVINTTRTES